MNLPVFLILIVKVHLLSILSCTAFGRFGWSRICTHCTFNAIHLVLNCSIQMCIVVASLPGVSTTIAWWSSFTSHLCCRFTELSSQVHNFYSGLDVLQANLPNKRVGLCANSSVQWYTADLACMLLGAISVSDLLHIYRVAFDYIHNMYVGCVAVFSTTLMYCTS